MRSIALILASSALHASATRLQAESHAESAAQWTPPENKDCDWYGNCCTESGDCSYDLKFDRYTYGEVLPDYVPGEWPTFWCFKDNWDRTRCYGETQAPCYSIPGYYSNDLFYSWGFYHGCMYHDGKATTARLFSLYVHSLLEEVGDGVADQVRNAIEPALEWLEGVNGWDDVVDRLSDHDFSDDRIPSFYFDAALDEAAPAIIYMFLNKDKWVDAYDRRNWKSFRKALKDDIDLDLAKRLLSAINWRTLYEPLLAASKFNLSVSYYESRWSASEIDLPADFFESETSETCH